MKLEDQLLFKVLQNLTIRVNVFRPLMLQYRRLFHVLQETNERLMFVDRWCSKTNRCLLCVSMNKTKESMISDLWCSKTNVFVSSVARQNKKIQCFWSSDAPKINGLSMYSKKQKSQDLSTFDAPDLRDKDKIIVCGPMMPSKSMVVQCFARTKTKNRCF